MIAQALGDQYNIPVQAGFLGNSGGSQLKAIHDPINRAEILKKRITILGADDISGTNVLLIDDVYRSGATLNACAQVLKESAKVTEIWVLTMYSKL